MPTQVPDLLVFFLPLIISTTLTVSVLGLAFSVAVWLLQRRPVSVAKGETNPSNASPIRSIAKIASVGFWLVVTGLHLLAWHLYLGQDSKYHLHGWSYLFSFIAILLAWRLWRLSQRTDSGRGAVIGPLGIQLLQVIGLSCCSSLLSDGPKPLFPQNPPGELVVCKTVRTDQGTPIQLYDREVEPSQLETFYLATQKELASMARQAMYRGQAAPQINCHGWVFSGQHTVKGEDVPIILKDNGYEEVDQPKLNDLVVYADTNGVVVHTGLVCGVFGEGTPIIQSKWGITDVYVHLVDEQPYSGRYCFYRSPRSGHTLRSCEPASESLVQDTRRSQNSDQPESKPTCQRAAALWVDEPQLAD